MHNPSPLQIARSLPANLRHALARIPSTSHGPEIELIGTRARRKLVQAGVLEDAEQGAITGPGWDVIDACAELEFG